MYEKIIEFKWAIGGFFTGAIGFCTWVVRSIFVLQKGLAVNNTKDISRDKEISETKASIKIIYGKLDQILEIVRKGKAEEQALTNQKLILDRQKAILEHLEKK